MSSNLLKSSSKHTRNRPFHLNPLFLWFFCPLHSHSVLLPLQNKHAYLYHKSTISEIYLFVFRITKHDLTNKNFGNFHLLHDQSVIRDQVSMLLQKILDFSPISPTGKLVTALATLAISL